MMYLPNPVYVEEKGVFNIISAPKDTILPAIEMAVFKQTKKSAYIADKNTELYEKLQVFHSRLSLFQWNYPGQVISFLKRARPQLAIIEYNRHFFNGNQAIIENTGHELKKLAESFKGTYLLISPFMDENLIELCSHADRVLIVENNSPCKGWDFIIKEKNTGCYVKRHKKPDDFSHHFTS